MEHRIVCVEGELKGGEVLLNPGESIMIGREPRFSNLIFRDLTVSRKHCKIEVDEQGEYYVTDYSACGIFTETGREFQKLTRERCGKGTILQIGKAGTKIALN